MYRITALRKPSASYLSDKDHDCIAQVQESLKSFLTTQTAQLSALYVRGSTVLGGRTSRSDLDLVFAVECHDIMTPHRIKRTLSALIKTQNLGQAVDVKVFQRQENRLLCHTTDEQYTQLYSKYLNFDVLMNGCCLQGEPLKNADGIYQSIDEFRSTTCFVQKLALRDLYHQYQRASTCSSNIIVKLIKRLIRLCAYQNFVSNDHYPALVRDCMNLISAKKPSLLEPLHELYNNYCLYQKGHAIDCSPQQLRLIDNCVTELLAYE